jgi:hypothetical protein
MVSRRKFLHLCTGLLPILLGVLAVGGLLLESQPASAANCIQDKFGKALQCTANDIQVAFADNIRDVNGNPLTKCIDTQTFSFVADFHVTTTASSRYDVGLWFATDGDPNSDGARGGTCSVNMITDQHTDPASPQVVTLGSAFAQNLDGDACRDVTTGSGWGKPNGRVVTVRVDNVLCKAAPGTNPPVLSFPNCTSWSQNSGGVCNTSDDTTPGSPSKCSCNAGFTVPILVDTGQGETEKKVTDPATASRPEPGGEFTYSISFKNTSQFVSVTLDRICDDKYGTIKYNAGPACASGTVGSINSTDCVLPQTLATGATYSCSFKANFTSSVAPASLTDTVTFYGHDSNTPPKPVQASASATAKISDVAPTATVTKSLDSIQCADVKYKVKVTNTDTAEDLTLSALTDDGFGDITQVQGNVLSTTCAVPQSISVGTYYECAFTAHFCGTSHTDKVTATVVDNDNGTIHPESDPLTVNVKAE